MIGRRDPGGDLRARIESELVQDALDVAVDGPLRNEEPGTDLLVAESLRDQPCDVHLSLAKQARGGSIGSSERRRGLFAERQLDCRFTAHYFSGLILGLEFRSTKRIGRRLFRL